MQKANKLKEFVEFEKKWKNKMVRPRGIFYKIPIKNYRVTAALYKYEDDITIFAIMAEDYNIKTNRHWFTIKFKPEDLKNLEDFEILEIP